MTDPAATSEARLRKVICFWLGRQQVAADIDHVKETIVLRPITRVFLMPRWLAGLINLRGDVVAVVDLAAFMGLPPTRLGDETRIVIARVQGKTAGLIVDRLAEAMFIDPEKLQPPPPGPGDGAELCAGVVTLEGGAPLALLDLTKLFDSERLRQFERRA